MAVSITTDLTILYDANTAFGGSVYSGFQRFGSACNGATVGNATSHFTGAVTSFDFRGKSIYSWMRGPAAIGTLAQGGYRIVISDGNNSRAYYVGGRDVLPFSAEGWFCFVLNADNLPTDFQQLAGAFQPELDRIITVGVGFTSTAKAQGNSPNVFWDVARVGTGLTIYGGTTGDPGTFADIVAAESSTSNAWGIVEDLGGGTFGCQGRLTFGRDLNETYTFVETNKTLVFENRRVGPNFYRLDVIRQPTGPNTSLSVFRFGEKLGVGDNVIGINGCTISGSDINVGILFDNRIGNVNIYGSTFSNIGQGRISLCLCLNTDQVDKHEFIANTLNECGTFDPQTSKTNQNIVINSSSDQSAFVWGDYISTIVSGLQTIKPEIKNTSFIANTSPSTILHRHGGEFEYDNLTFNGNTVDIEQYIGFLEPNTLLDGLMFSYSMETNATLVDDSINNNDGTNTDTTLVAGSIGNALEYNGTSSISTVTSNSIITSPTTAVTMMVDMYPTAVGQANVSLVFGKDNNETGSQSYGIGFNSARQLRLRIGTVASPTDQLTTALIPLNQWTRIIFRYERNVIRDVRIGGITETYGNAGVTMTHSANALTIGSAFGGGATGRRFQGRIDNVMTWNRALTNDEINSLIDDNLEYADIDLPLGELNLEYEIQNALIKPTRLAGYGLVDSLNIDNYIDSDILILVTTYQEVTPGNTPEAESIWRSVDGGVSWTKVLQTTFTNASWYYPTNILRIPTVNSNIGFAGIGNSFWKTTNSGLNWSNIFTTTNFVINNVTINTTGEHVYVIGFDITVANTIYIRYSSDFGVTFTTNTHTFANNQLSNGSSYMSNNGSTLYYFNYGQNPPFTKLLYKFTNFGANITQITIPNDPNVTNYSIMYMPDDLSYIALSVRDTYFVKSTNDGVLWTDIPFISLRINQIKKSKNTIVPNRIIICHSQINPNGDTLYQTIDSFLTFKIISSNALSFDSNLFFNFSFNRMDDIITVSNQGPTAGNIIEDYERYSNVTANLFNGSDATTTLGDVIINNPTIFRVIGLVPDTEVRVFRTSDRFELAGIESSTTTFEYQYNYSAVDINVYLVVHKETYEYIKIPDIILSNEDQTITVQQRFDRNFIQ